MPYPITHLQSDAEKMIGSPGLACFFKDVLMMGNMHRTA